MMKKIVKVFFISIFFINFFIQIIINFVTLTDFHDSQLVELEVSNSTQLRELRGKIIIIYYLNYIYVLK
jgi:hypothetical protein